MSKKATQSADFTSAELKFLASLKKLFKYDGGNTEAIQQQVYEAIEKELAGQGASSIEAVTRAGKTVFMQKYGKLLQEANQDIALCYKEYQSRPSQKTELLYRQAIERLTTLYRELEDDSKKAHTTKTEKLAVKSGLQSEEEITKAEKRFLKALAKLLGKSTISLMSPNETLYNALVKELSKKGESTLEDITRIVEAGLNSDQRKQVTVPSIQKIAKKAGIKNSKH